MINYNDYFLSEGCAIIFILVHIDGKTRMQLLNVNITHYSTRNKADEWFNRIKLLLKTERIHADYESAMKEAECIYENMIK